MPIRQSRSAATATWCLILTICASPLAAAVDSVVLGEGIQLIESTPIYEILADPDAYVGRTVRVEGGVLDVCPKKGCWVELDAGDATLRIKVEDDVIVFPADATGRILTVQGTVEALEMDRERYVAWLSHQAEERGEAFDADTVDVGDGPYRVIQIRGTGAELEAE